MKFSLQDLLSWMWQVFLSWLAAITTGIDRPLCLERSAKMVVKANDPEMAVGSNGEKEKSSILSKLEEPPGVQLREEGEVPETFPRIESIEVVRTGQATVENIDDAGTVREASIASGSDGEDEDSSEGTLTDSSATEDNGQDALVVEDNEEIMDFANIIGDELIESIADDWGNVNENQREASNVEERVTKKQRHNVNENDDVDDEEEEDGDTGEVDISKDTKVTWLLELKSRDAYQTVLSPHYHCLNFRTVSSLDFESVVTAIKQLHSLLPWLGLGLKRQKNMWLCLLPEDCLNFQMAHYEEDLWDIVVNSRDQFNYMEDRCLSSFVLMKGYPCVQCEAVIDLQTPVNTSIMSTGSCTCSATATTNGLETTKFFDSKTSSDDAVGTSVNSAPVEKISCEGTIVLPCEIADHELHNVNESSEITEPRTAAVVLSSVVNVDEASASCASVHIISRDPDIEQEKDNSANDSITSENSSTSNSDLKSTDNSQKEKDFTHNYRLVFGVPNPFADEKSVNMICDAFLKELNTVISKKMETACVNTTTDKTVPEETSVESEENKENEITSEIDSSSNNDENCQQVSPQISNTDTNSREGEPAGTSDSNRTEQASSMVYSSEGSPHDSALVNSNDESNKAVTLNTLFTEENHDVPQGVIENGTLNTLFTEENHEALQGGVENGTLNTLNTEEKHEVAQGTENGTPNTLNTEENHEGAQGGIENGTLNTLNTEENQEVAQGGIKNGTPNTLNTKENYEAAQGQIDNGIEANADDTSSRASGAVSSSEEDKGYSKQSNGDPLKLDGEDDGGIDPNTVNGHTDLEVSQRTADTDVEESQGSIVSNETEAGSGNKGAEGSHIQRSSVVASDGILGETTIPSVPNHEMNTTVTLGETDTGKEEAQAIIAKKKASVQEHLDIISEMLASVCTESEEEDENKFPPNNNIENVVNRKSPQIERKIEIPNTKNFINRCKSERVSFVSAFGVCVNAGLANTLVKYKLKEEKENLMTGHTISHYYSLEDLTDDEWHDHDPVDNDDECDEDDEKEEARYKVCCKRPTATLNLKPEDLTCKIWERTKFVDQKRREVKVEGKRTYASIIPLNTELKSTGDEIFPAVCYPQADYGITNISNLIPRYFGNFDKVESMTLQKLSPMLVFLMTNSISLSIHDGALRFSFYNPGQFVSQDIAHQYADEIVSAVNRSLVS